MQIGPVIKALAESHHLLPLPSRCQLGYCLLFGAGHVAPSSTIIINPLPRAETKLSGVNANTFIQARVHPETLRLREVRQCVSSHSLRAGIHSDSAWIRHS